MTTETRNEAAGRLHVFVDGKCNRCEIRIEVAAFMSHVTCAEIRADLAAELSGERRLKGRL